MVPKTVQKSRTEQLAPWIKHLPHQGKGMNSDSQMPTEKPGKSMRAACNCRTEKAETGGIAWASWLPRLPKLVSSGFS